ILLTFFLLFFFSSSRRHTRCLSDWSSDVCSSDLWWFAAPSIGFVSHNLRRNPPGKSPLVFLVLLRSLVPILRYPWILLITLKLRSEERRVGKERILLCLSYIFFMKSRFSLLLLHI